MIKDKRGAKSKMVCQIVNSRGRVLYSLLDNELRNRRTDRTELVEIIVEYLFEANTSSIQNITRFLHKELE